MTRIHVFVDLLGRYGDNRNDPPLDPLLTHTFDLAFDPTDDLESDLRSTVELTERFLRSLGSKHPPKEPSKPRSTRIKVQTEHPDFGEFWEAYPHRVKRLEAVKVFTRLTRSVDPRVIIDGALRFGLDPNLPEKRFIPHPTTWLNQGRWEDGPLPPRTTGRPLGRRATVTQELLSEIDEDDRDRQRNPGSLDLVPGDMGQLPDTRNGHRAVAAAPGVARDLPRH